MAGKKGGKKKKTKTKKSTLQTIRNITGPLNDERLGYILWGAHFKTSIEAFIPKVNIDPPVHGRPMPSYSRQLSNTLHNRINEPLSTARARTSSMASRDSDIPGPPSPQASPLVERMRKIMLERIKKKLDRTECVLDLIELSAEMFLLRSMILDRKHQMLELNEAELQIIEKDAAIIAKNAAQTKLLDAAGDGVEFAKHLRSVWEILYFRGSGGITLPDIDIGIIKNASEEEPQVVLKDTKVGFGRSVVGASRGDALSDKEDEEEEEEEEEDDLLMSMDGRSSLEGAGGESDDEEIDRRWTFTSESVDEYLRQRKLEEEIAFAAANEEHGGSVHERNHGNEEGADLHSSLLVENSLESKSGGGESQELLLKSLTGSPSQKRKKKVRIAGFVKGEADDINDDESTDADALRAEDEQHASPLEVAENQVGDVGDVEDIAADMSPRFGVEVEERRASLPVAVANVVKFLSGSFGRFGKPKVSTDITERSVDVMLPQAVHTTQLTLEGAEGFEDSHSAIRYSQHMTELLAIQQQRIEAATAASLIAADLSSQQENSGKDVTYGDDMNDDEDARGYLSPKTPHVPTKPPTGARGILRRSVTTNYDPSSSVSTQSDDVSAPTAIIPLLSKSENTSASSLFFHHNTSEIPNSSILTSTNTHIQEALSVSTSLHQMTHSSSQSKVAMIPIDVPYSVEVPSIENPSMDPKPVVAPEPMNDSIQDTTSVVDMASMEFQSVELAKLSASTVATDVGFVSSASGRAVGTNLPSLASRPPPSPASKMRIDIRAITLRATSPAADLGAGGLESVRPEVPHVFMSTMADSPRLVHSTQSVNSLMQNSQHTANTTVYRPEVVAPAVVPPRGALLLEENSQGDSSDFVWQKSNSSSYHMCDVMLPFDQRKGKELKASLKQPYKPPLMSKKKPQPSPVPPVNEVVREVLQSGLVEEMSTISDTKDNIISGGLDDDYHMLFIENCLPMQSAIQPPDFDKFSVNEDLHDVGFLGDLKQPIYELVHSEEIVVSERWRGMSSATLVSSSTVENRRPSVLSMGCGIGDDFFSRDDVDSGVRIGGSASSPTSRGQDGIDLSKRIDPTLFHKRLYLGTGSQREGGKENLTVSGQASMNGAPARGAVAAATMVMETEKGYSYRLKPFEVQQLNGEKLVRMTKVFVSYPINKTEIDFNECYYDEDKDHFHLTRVRNGETLVDLSIPFTEIVPTECVFDGMVSLRTTSDLADDDYVTSIPISDWIVIVNHERRSYKQKCDAEDRRRIQENREHPKKFPFPMPPPIGERGTARAVRPTPPELLRANSEMGGGLYSSAPVDDKTFVSSMLHSFTEPGEVEPPAVPESDLLREFTFLAAEELQNQQDATFLTGYLSEDSVRHNKSAPPQINLTGENQVEAVGKEPAPPAAEAAEKEAAAKQSRMLRKLNRRYRAVKSFDAVDVDCMYRGLRREGSVTSSSVSMPQNNDRSPSPTARKPALMSSVHDEDDIAMVVGGEIDEMSVVSKSRDIHTAGDGVSIAIDLHSRSYCDATATLKEGITRPKTHTSTNATGELPSNLRARPFTTQAAGQKLSLQTKLLDADITRPLKAGYSLTSSVTLSPRGTSSLSSRARSAYGSSTDMDDSRIRNDNAYARRPSSMPRSNRSPRMGGAKSSQVEQRVDVSELAVLSQMLATPPMYAIAPPQTQEQSNRKDSKSGKGRIRRRKQEINDISKSLMVVKLQQPKVNIMEPSTISLES